MGKAGAFGDNKGMRGGGEEPGLESELFEASLEPGGAIATGVVVIGIGTDGGKAQEIHPCVNTGAAMLSQPLIQLIDFHNAVLSGSLWVRGGASSSSEPGGVN
jgi:hypothetical protein